MYTDRPDRIVDQGQNPLRFTEGVGEQDGSNSSLLIGLPPPVDFFSDAGRFGPAKDRQAKRAFGYERVALLGLERFAGGIGLPFVVSGDNAYVSRAFDPDLRGAQ